MTTAHPQFPPQFARFQERIDWVDQPPPAQARDTHALFFSLWDNGDPPTPLPLRYDGLLFFRPGDPDTISGADQPRLEGIASLIVPPSGTSSDHNAVRARINLRVRANIPDGYQLATTLTFFKRDPDVHDVPSPVIVRTVESVRTKITEAGFLEIETQPIIATRYTISLFRTTVLQETVF
jgi:hypothetical protein